MAGRVMITIFNILFLTYMIIFVTFFYLHKTMQANVEEVTYQVAEIVSTRGEFSKNLYDYMRTELSKYGKFDILISYDKKNEQGKYETFYDDSIEIYNAFENADSLIRNQNVDKIEIVSGNDIASKKVNDTKFRIEDRVTIQVQSKEPTIFGKILNAATMGYTRDKFIDTKLFSLKTAVVSNSPENLVYGYDIVMELQNVANDEIIEVITKGNFQNLDMVYNYAADTSDKNLKYTDGAGTIVSDFKFIRQENILNKYNLNTPITNNNYIFTKGSYIREVTEDVKDDNSGKIYRYISYRYVG